MRSTALITGASSGLGAEFATQLAARGHEVILVARSGDRLAALAKRLVDEHGVRAHVLVQDLAEPDAARRIAHQLTARGLSVDLLVNNAGFGTCGRPGKRPAGRPRTGHRVASAARLRSPVPPLTGPALGWGRRAASGGVGGV
ncbi:SDR family NAD(P)-dependent oxidoreductase [Actinomadura citrea]|uniref:Short-subunit dehydrogenase n=1 Tax=Actinomadura citrea TaxID=46158 RepID=A0A7Y9KD94_9ACTN|nr:SDR family NAD(P)-dependent oxidoreductase [Actinomadura citrea]NYE14842.1 short-subunit dehydrogenase [Actinomadura citrea]GGT82490.1 hypothetical protein GCM10010177_46920 [Actinomadura citrea]